MVICRVLELWRGNEICKVMMESRYFSSPTMSASNCEVIVFFINIQVAAIKVFYTSI